MTAVIDRQANSTQCLVNIPRCQLIITKQLDQAQTQVCFDLPARRKLQQPNLKMSDHGLATLEVESSTSRMRALLVDSDCYGLSLEKSSYLYEDTRGVPPAYFFETQNLIFPGAYSNRPAQGPYDLFVSSDQQYLAVVNRREAEVLIFDLEQVKLIAQHHFVAFEGDKVITVALDSEGKYAYLAGADSRQVWQWNIKTAEVKPIEGPWTFPTHVLLDDRSLWVLDSHKKSSLHHYQLESQQTQEIALTGSGYAHLTDTPADLLFIDQDQARLAVLTHQPLPDPLTPVLTWVDTQTAKVIATSQPAKRTWPGLLTKALINPEYQALMKRQREFLPETPPVVIKALLASFGLSLQKFKSQLLILSAKTATPVDLPTRTREVILGMIQTRLQEEHGVQMALPPRQSEAQEIVIHAEQLAQLMRSNETLDVVIYHLMGRYTVGLKLNRLDLFAQLESAGIAMASAPELVPELELENTEPDLVYTRLPPGDFTLADPLNNRLLQLNSDLKVIWQLDSSWLNIYQPVDFVWMGSSFLILDTESGEATCWNLSAKREWQVSSQDHHWNQVRFLKSSSPLVLGLDISAGILEAFNIEGKFQWKIDASVLDCATAEDIWVLCENARLMQIDQKGTLLNEFQLTGHPAVLAASMKNIAVFDPIGQSIEIINIESLDSTVIPIPVSSPRYLIEEPGGIKWLDQDCLIYDGYRLLRVDTETQTVSASFLMQDLQLLSAKVNQAPTSAFYSRDHDPTQFQGGSQHSLIEVLKKVSLFNQAPESFFSEIADMISTRVYNRGEFIVTKGDVGKEMYLIRQGEVEVMGAKMTDVVARMVPGDIFGEVALMTGQKRNATVRAKSYCEIICFVQKDLEQLLSDYPDVRERLILLAQKRSLQEQLRSEAESERLKERLQTLQTQRQQMQQTRQEVQERNQVSQSAAVAVQVSESAFEVWVRDHADAQLQKLSSSGQVSTVIGNPEDGMQPFQALETVRFRWVLDMGQNQLFKCELINGSTKPEAIPDLSLNQGLDKQERLWVSNTGKGQVLMLTKAGQVLRQLSYDRAPASVQALNSDLVVANVREHTVSRMDSDGEVIWQFGTPRKFGRDENHLFAPEYAQLLVNGNVLITDTGNSRVLEVDSAGQIVWSLLSGAGLRMMRPSRALRLDNGNTLIEHSSRSQWIEINSALRLMWRYQVNKK